MPPADLVIHDGSQTHDAYVDIILLADDSGIPQGLPAVGGGQPGGCGRGRRVRAPGPQLPALRTSKVPFGARGTYLTHI